MTQMEAWESTHLRLDVLIFTFDFALSHSSRLLPQLYIMASTEPRAMSSSFLSRFNPASNQPPSTPGFSNLGVPGEGELGHAMETPRLDTTSLAYNPAMPNTEGSAIVTPPWHDDSDSQTGQPQLNLFAPRRPRDPIDEDMFNGVRRSPYPAQQLRAFAVARCAAAGLSADQTMSILEFADVSENFYSVTSCLLTACTSWTQCR